MGWVASERWGEVAWPTMASGVVDCDMGQVSKLFYWQVVTVAALLWQ
jgi:hypothetical protein